LNIEYTKPCIVLLKRVILYFSKTTVILPCYDVLTTLKPILYKEVGRK